MLFTATDIPIPNAGELPVPIVNAPETVWTRAPIDASFSLVTATSPASTRMTLLRIADLALPVN